MKITLNIKPKDIIAITHADDGRACICMAIGTNVEVFLTAEEQAEDLMDRLMDEEGDAE